MTCDCVTWGDNAGRWTDYSRFKARKDETMTYRSCESNDRQYGVGSGKHIDREKSGGSGKESLV
jgi:hypothetical protein